LSKQFSYQFLGC